jgi:hypothetical protein
LPQEDPDLGRNPGAPGLLEAGTENGGREDTENGGRDNQWAGREALTLKN